MKPNAFDEPYECVAILKEGQSFGEMALVSNQPRLASIQCIENCMFGVLEK